ncbi:DSC E3 ubiquitin ligase complex subunit 1 [Cyphellophora attinorum]|uniref:RING-type E3 ubiquitin transferase n=1 Tax=Cyphellophora attinorum TaxID=1664694 RepID=A0A0N1GYX5_9EURO|nr:DSC E3 ubiquitin ligase complex subunit 1 [Phialophora attinorum]KPI36042.1 DSC E3 ubiquitin ligase complex subunit 1 [Phialophora attinorum]
MPQGDGQEGQRVLFFFLILFFIYAQPAAPPPPVHGETKKYWDDERQRDFDVLANTTYGDFRPGHFLNLTAFREDDAHQWEVLPKVQDLSRKQVEESWRGLEDVGSYKDISGDVRGNFKRSTLSVTSSPLLNLTALDPRKEYIIDHFQRNITEPSGEITLSFTDDEAPKSSWDARPLSAEISIWSDSAPGTGWQTMLHGVHFPTGAAILTTSSTKFDALPALPHFALDVFSFIAAVPVMNDTVTEAWKRHRRRPETYDVGVPRCEMIVWLQPKPLEGSSTYLEMIEDELAHPQGAPIGTPPALSFSMVLFSPDCGYVLEADTLTGAKTEVFTQLTNRLLSAFAILLAVQITLIKRQMKKASTPSTRSRIAYQSIAIAALGDGLIMLGMVLLLSLNETSFMLIATVIFLAIIHMAVLEVKFVYDLWTVQVGEPQHAEAERERREAVQRRQAALQAQQQQQSTQAQAPEASKLQILLRQTCQVRHQALQEPFPKTTTHDYQLHHHYQQYQQPSRLLRHQRLFQLTLELHRYLPVLPTTNPAINTIIERHRLALLQVPTPPPRVTFATIYARFYFLLLLTLLFSLIATSFPRPLRSAYTNFLAFAYFSLWIPQIYRNVQRNCRKALSWEYVLGASACRLVGVLYWWVSGENRNLLGVKKGTTGAVVLGAWMAVQVLLLLGQGVFGGRCVAPKWLFREATPNEVADKTPKNKLGWFVLPRAWEYHPVLIESPPDAEQQDLESAGGEESALLGGGKSRMLNNSEMSVHLLASAGEAKLDDAGPSDVTNTGDASRKSKRTFDCAICMNEISIPTVVRDSSTTLSSHTQDTESGPTKGNNKAAPATATSRFGLPNLTMGLSLERSAYMVTPCRHVFHTACLEGWMDMRLVCPVCRESLPSL